MSAITDLLYEAIAAESRGMHYLAACKARRAAVAAQAIADAIQHEALCLREIEPAIEFEPVDAQPLPVPEVEDLTYDLPQWLRRAAE